jgi:hypothetical protein
MIRYAPLFDAVRELARTWHAGDMAAHCALDHPLSRLAPDQVAEFVEEFCGLAGDHAADLGADEVGGLIWYLMGSGSQIWFDVAKASREYAEDAILSLRFLYERCFARFVGDWTHGGKPGPGLDTACYMLWDMDGGLEGIPMSGQPGPLVPVCYTVLEHALSLESSACWESALHGLGHIVFEKPQPAQGLIDGFLAAREGRLPEHVVRYARDARDGAVQ